MAEVDKNHDAMYKKLVVVVLIGVIVALCLSMAALLHTYDLENKINLLNDKIDRIDNKINTIKSYESEMRQEVTILKEGVDDLNAQMKTIHNLADQFQGEFGFDSEGLDFTSILKDLFSAGIDIDYSSGFSIGDNEDKDP